MNLNRICCKRFVVSWRTNNSNNLIKAFFFFASWRIQIYYLSNVCHIWKSRKINFFHNDIGNNWFSISESIKIQIYYSWWQTESMAINFWWRILDSFFSNLFCQYSNKAWNPEFAYSGSWLSRIQLQKEARRARDKELERIDETICLKLFTKKKRNS